MKGMTLNQGKAGRLLDFLTAGDRLFFLSYGILLIGSLLSTSFYYRFFDGRPFYAVQLGCVALLFAYEYRTGGVRSGQWVALLLSAFMCLVTVRVAEGNLTRLTGIMFLYIFSARKIPFPKIADFTLRISFVTVAFIVFSGYLGIIDDVVMYKAGRVRGFLGFRYTLFAPGILLNMTALYVYLRKERIAIPAAIFWALLNWYVYEMTDSRISFALAEVLIVAALLMRFLPKLVRKLHALWAVAAASFGIFGIGSLIMTFCYNSSIHWMRRLNNMMEGRLNLGKKSLSQHGISLFGKQIIWTGNGLDVDGNVGEGVYDYVDCLYVKNLQLYGIIFTILLMVLLCWAMFRLWKRREYHVLLICASVAAHCVLDDLSFVLHYNTFWIAMGVALIAPQMLQWDGKTNQLPQPEPPIE